MEDVNISKFRAQVVRAGSTPASPGFVVSEGQNPVDPSGSGQNHLPVTIAEASTGLSITESQVLGGAGTVSQYIRGDGSLADFPSITGGGSSVSYYLNGSVSQGTIGGVAYRELNRTPVFGAGTDISINADGYIASFITDAGDPNKLLIPAGNWNFETYFSASSSGGSPSFYVELYKYDGTTFTLIASSSTSPELIAFGTSLNPYFSTLAVPQTTLALTDRLAIRFYVNHSGRTITLHTEDNHLCQIITSFTTGLTALNNLTTQVQFFAVGTSGSDFNIASSVDTHTFNLPTASATNRGALSSADWSTFNNKENAITAGTTAQYFRGDKTFQTLNTSVVPEGTNLYYTEARVNANTNVAANTAARHNAVTLGTANGLSLSTQVLSLGLASAGVTGALSGTDWSTFNSKQNALTLTTTGTSGAATLVGSTLNIPQYQAAGTYVTAVTASSPLASSGGTTPNITIQQASGSQNGFLSSTDWTTFNNKQNALTNPVTGTGTTNYLAKFTGTTTVGNSQVFDNGTSVGINTATPAAKFDILQTSSGLGGWYMTSQFSGTNYPMIILAAITPNKYSRIGNDGDGSFMFFTNGSSSSLGTQSMTLTSGGNLLVGTTTDNGEKLQVNGEITAVTRIRINKSTQTNQIFGDGNAFNISGSNNLGIRNDSGSIVFASGGANVQMLLNTSGNVGIGTTSPNRLLTVSGTQGLIALNATSYRNTTIGSDSVGNFIVYDDTAAAYRMVINSSGNVGIGTTAPAHKLSIKGASNYDGVISVDNSTTTGGGAFLIRQNGVTSGFIGVVGSALGNSDRTLAYYGESGIGHRFFVNDGTTSLFLNSSGNVGIGTSSPAERLVVKVGTNQNFEFRQASSLGSYTGVGLDALNDGRTDIVDLVLRGKTLSLQANSTHMEFLTNSTEAMRITTSRNVLIGTTTDGGARLQIVSSGVALNMATSNGQMANINSTNANGGYITWQTSGTTIADLGTAQQIFGSGGNDTFGINGRGARALTFGTSDTERMRITSGGNVLIGTTTDNGNKLRVNGVGFFDQGVRTGQPVGTTTNNWLLGRALASGTSTPDRWIRVQIGLEYYDILAVYMGTLQL